ncbi:hypothetical protein C8R46DRAFT_1024816 [Mycena filopes]|nr:hypothetical protein C8R46DRAFT_1024816 [Mycena filopes]
MAPRVVPPPKKNRARCGIKYPLQIVKGDLGPDSEYLDEDPDENQFVLAVADVDANEGNEHHLQAALATKALFIPTPGTVGVVASYEQLYPQGKWTDPVTYVCTSSTVDEAISTALADDCTYYMDERDKEWLDKNNQQARGEGTSAQGARTTRHGKDKEPEIGVPVSISEDEFELVMGLLEKISGQQVLADDNLDFSSYQQFFTKPLPANIFASYTTPSWIPPSAMLVRIARTIYPHWKQRRTLLDGRRIRPLLNFDESDILNESYICFRRRDNKPVRKTRAAQLANNADKLTNLHKNLTQVLDMAGALLTRESVKQAAAVQSQKVWRVRQPLADMLRQFPGMLTKADEERLFEKPRKHKAPRASLKIKVTAPSQPGSPAAPPPPALLPSERFALIEQKVKADLQQEAAFLERHHQVDGFDDPYQAPPTPRSEQLWVEVPRANEEEGVRGGARALRLRYGRGGRRFVDRRSSSHPYLSELRKQRQHADDDTEPDEEATRRLRSQWRFDGDDGLFEAAPEDAEEEGPDPIEFGGSYQLGRLRYLKDAKEESALVIDTSLRVQQPNGKELRVIPGYFHANAYHVTDMYAGKWSSLNAFLAEQGIEPQPPPFLTATATPPRATPVAQKGVLASASGGGGSPSYVHPHPRAPAPTPAPMRPPPSGSPAQSRLQENISPPAKKPFVPSSSGAHLIARGSSSSSLSPHSAARASSSSSSLSPHSAAARASSSSSLSPHSAAARGIPRGHPALPHNPNPIVTVSRADAVKAGPVNVNVNVNAHAHASPSPSSAHGHGLQTNGARTALPAYVPLGGAGTNMNHLKLPTSSSSRVPARPSPLATHSVVAPQMQVGSPSSRTKE